MLVIALAGSVGKTATAEADAAQSANPRAVTLRKRKVCVFIKAFYRTLALLPSEFLHKSGLAAQEQLPSELGRAFCGFLVWYRTVPPTRSVSKILGETIRAERIRAGLTQEQLAEKADLARNYIGNVERAEYKITVETLARIAKALNFTVHDLTRGI